MRPGYLEITATAPEHYQVVWKQPVRDRIDSVAGLGLQPVFPDACEPPVGTRIDRRPGVLVERFELHCPGGLAGQMLAIAGLQRTITDVFVRLSEHDGTVNHLRLTADSPVQQFTGGGMALANYLSLGTEHLLLGADHLLFILGLVLLLVGWRQLIATVTAFTLAHSLTLACSVLGLIRLPVAPIEACIALSVLFIAGELMQQPQQRSTLTSRYPYAIALGFGLLHGFGFATVLGDIGLPKDDALWALALFNLGVEFGQLLVIALLLTARWLLRYSTRVSALAGRWSRVPAVGMGIIASWWLVERIAAMLG